MTPKLSFVVPVYQVEDYIDECLASIRAQTLTDFECVIVDDGSRDGSVAIAEKYVAGDPRFKLVRQQNAGLGPARNTGVRHATGKYLMFIDSDDVIPPRAGHALVSALERTGSDMAVGNACRFGTDAGVVQSWAHAELMAVDRDRTHILEFPLLHRDRMAWNKVFRRSFWDEQGFEFPAIRYEDYPVTIPAHVQARSVDVVSDHVYFWRDRPSKDSITQLGVNVDNAVDRVESAMTVLDYLDERIKSDPANAARLDVVRRSLCHYLYLTDMVTLAHSLVCADQEQREQLLPIVLDYARRIEAGVESDSDFFRSELFQALRRKDWKDLTSLIWLRERDWKRFVKSAPKLGLLGRAGLKSSRRLLTKPGGVRRLRSSLVGAETGTTGVHLRIKTLLRPQLVRRASFSATLVGQRKLSLPTRLEGQQIYVQISNQFSVSEPLVLELVGKVGPVTWRGTVSGEPFAETIEVHPGVFVGGLDGCVTVWRTSDVAISVHACQLDFVDVEAAGETLVVQRSDPAQDLRFPIVAGVARIPWADVVAGDPVDNPVDGTTVRPLLVEAEGVLKPTVMTGYSCQVRVENELVALKQTDQGGAIVRSWVLPPEAN